MEFTIFVGAGILFGALVAALWVIFQQDSKIKKLKEHYKENFDDYNMFVGDTLAWICDYLKDKQYI